MGRGRSTPLRYAMRAWERGRSPGAGNHGAMPEDYAGQYSSAIEAAVARRNAARAKIGVRPPTPLRVAVVAGVWIVAVACVVYPWVLWSLM